MTDFDDESHGRWREFWICSALSCNSLNVFILPAAYFTKTEDATQLFNMAATAGIIGSTTLIGSAFLKRSNKYIYTLAASTIASLTAFGISTYMIAQTMEEENNQQYAARPADIVLKEDGEVRHNWVPEI